MKLFNKMKVILKEEIKNLGKKGDVVEVKDGYGRNYLLRKQLALLATKKAILDLEKKKEAETKKVEEETKKIQDLANALQKEVLEFKLKTNPKGEPFGSVTRTKILNELLKRNYRLKKFQIQLEKPLKEFKEYLIKIKLDYNIFSEIKVKVLKEK